MFETLALIIREHKELGLRQILKLAKAELNRQYRGAALGWAWAIIKPMLTLFVFWFGITIGLRYSKPVNGYPRFLWNMTGFLPWFYMRALIPGGAACIRQYKHLVTKMKFPVSVIPTFNSVAELYIHLVLMALTFLVFAIFGYFRPDIYLLQLPLYLIFMFLSFTLWSLFAGMVGAISKDFHAFIKSISTAIFWFSGIIFDINGIHNSTLRHILKINPVAFFAMGYRNVFIYKRWFFEDKFALAMYCITLTLTFVGAMWAYKRLRKEIPDVL